MTAQRVRTLLLLPLAAVAIVCLVALSPWKRIRIGRIDSSRIGHFVTTMEAYLCAGEAGLRRSRPDVVDAFHFTGAIANAEVARQCRARLLVLPFHALAELVVRIARRIPVLARRHLIPAHELTLWGESNERALHRFRGHLRVPEAVRNKGKDMLARTARGRPIVCLHVRDGAYLRATQPDIDFSYHDYRDWDPRTLGPAIALLSTQGYFPVRMGSVVGGSFPFPGEIVFDYPLSGLRSDELDLFLAAHCAFWVGTASGLLDLPFAFRRPMVVLNHASPLLAEDPRITLYQHSVWTFKKFWSEELGRVLSFREILETGIGRCSTSSEFRASGVRLMENSADEVRDAVDEMVSRANRTWKESDLDKDLQTRFWSLWGADWPARAARADCRISARFLAANPDLLT